MGGSEPGPGAGVDAILAHFGVKGMRWGVRRSMPSTGAGKPTRMAPSEDATRTAASKRTVKVSGTKALSNAELQQLVNRLNLEKQLSQINPSAKRQALRFTTDILVNVGKQQITRIATDIATKQIVALLKR